MTATGKLTRLASGYGLLEGARWYPGRGLVFSDMTNGGVYQLKEPGAGHPEVVIPHRKAIGGLVAHADGGLVVSGRNVSIKADDGATTVLLEAEPDEQFFNDISADARGRLFAGSMPRRAEGATAGRLYVIDLDGAVTALADDVLISNGIGADPADRLLYHVDSERRTVWQFELGAPDPGRSRTAFVSTAGYDALPDGLAVAADGSVWVALAGAGLVVGWDAAGRRLAEIEVPHALVTSVCFGGPALDRLYILTGTDAEHPNPDGGSVFTMAAPTIGLPAPVAQVRRA
ncbi:MAG TPA: SMP-30/gluconolactonase/LRE family protein [Trebonia sp.]|jgi:gluconolactonase|nr:SMP-30/gluconolactonase/LRE family protein [Trebonia sp.]